MNPNPMPEPTYAAFIGLDWAKETHAVCFKTSPDSDPQLSQLTQSPEALEKWAAALKERTAGRPVALCLEIKRGALINALCVHEWIHIYPINPKTSANYRKALYPSGQKDDPKDAELLCDFLAKHMGKLKRWLPESPEIQELRTLCEQRDALVDERTRLSHKLDDALRQYFPQAVEFAGPSHLPASWDFLRKWSSLPDLQKARKATILAFFHATHVRRGDKLTDTFHERVQAATPLTTAPSVVRPLQLLVVGLCRTLSALQDLIESFGERIKELYQGHPLCTVTDSFPGAGKVLGPRVLLAVAGAPDRFPDAAAWLTTTGIPPVIESSGKSLWTHWRWFAPTFTRQSLHEFAAASISHSAWAGAYYHQMTKIKEKSRAMAIRSLAFKWGRILFACVASGKPYREENYLRCLASKGSPLPELILSMARERQAAEEKQKQKIAGVAV